MSLSKSSIVMSIEENEFKKLCPGFEPLMTTIPAEPGRRIIAIGDTHGDWKITIRALLLAKVIRIDSKGEPHWAAEPKNTIVVQLGDQVDRCRPGVYPCSSATATENDEASDIRILYLFTHLDKEARRVGGAVYSLLGNHELMNVNGDIRYASRANLDSAAAKLGIKNGEEARRKEFAPGGKIAKMMACTRSSIIIIGETIFAHAGVVPALFNHLPTGDNRDHGIYWFNTQIRKWLLGQINDSNVETITTSMEISPFWTRILGKIPSSISKEHPDCEKYLAPVFQALDIGRMVIGHTPQIQSKEMANTTCSNKLARVDIASSQAFEGLDGREKGKLRPVQVAEIIVGGNISIIRE